MKSKKAVVFIILLALIAAIGICYASEKGGETVFDVRLVFDKDGYLKDVVPIDSKKHGKDRLDSLEKERIYKASVVLFGEHNPTCTYWWTYRTGSGWVRICLNWEP